MILHSSNTYKSKDVNSTIVVSVDADYDVYFKDVIGEYHCVTAIHESSISKAVNTALSLCNLTYNDIIPGTIVSQKYGWYTMMKPSKAVNGRVEMVRKQFNKRYRILSDKHIVEEKVSVREWLPFSKYANIAHTEEGMKKLEKEVHSINMKNKRATARMH